MSENPLETLLEEKELAETLQVSLGTLRMWRAERKGPRFHRIGQLIRYSPSDVRAWLTNRQGGGEAAEVVR
jgi:excisionase family DNA binding protein